MLVGKITKLFLLSVLCTPGLTKVGRSAEKLGGVHSRAIHEFIHEFIRVHLSSAGRVWQE